MRFLNPSGLWLLLGVPVLIIIYLIKSRHEDRPVSSTYIWKLSSRFMKKRLPLQRLRKLLLFLLQLLMVVCISLMAARPAIITGKSREYIAIVDASASMHTKDDDGTSRFLRALDQVRELADCIDRGHRLSVILAADNASFLVQSSDSVNNVRLALDNAACAYGSCDIEEAIALTAPLSQRAATQVYFYTDCNYPDAENIRVVNLNENEWNVSVDGVSIDSTDEGDEYISGTLTSHNRHASVSVGLRVDGVLTAAKTLDCVADTAAQVSFPMPEAPNYETLELFIEEKDGLQADNSYCLITGHDRTYNVLLASDSPLYLNSVLGSLGNCLVTTVSSPEHIALTGYDLYVFDGIFPEDYPTDGSVIQFGTDKLPDGVGSLAAVTAQTKLEKHGGTDSDLYKDLSLFDTVLAQYTPLTGNANWQALLYCGSDPVCMSKDLGTGLCFTVFSFDLHHSNLPMQTDYVVLMRNLVEMSVFDLLSSTDHSVGQTVELAVLPAAEQLYVELPNGRVKALSTENTTGVLIPETPGIYTAVITTAEGGDYADFFVHIPQDEVLCPDGNAIAVPRSANTDDAQDAIMELWLYLAAALLILLLLEWGVYHFEQY